MLNMTETLAIELAPKYVLMQFSGPVVTEAFAQVLGADGAEEEIAATIPLGFSELRMISPQLLSFSQAPHRWVTGRIYS